MTDQTATEEPDGEAGTDIEDSEGSKSGRRMPGKKLVLFIVLPFLLIGATGGGIYASGLLDSLLGSLGQQDTPATSGPFKTFTRSNACLRGANGAP